MLEGSCLCGRVCWRFDAVPDGATACNCTACRRYGALWIYGHDGEDVRVVGGTTAYQRPQHSSLTFHFCPTCGCGFGAQKYLTLPGKLIDADYAQLYSAYAEADSTEGEIRTFRALQPKKGGAYLNWGCGAWSGAIDRLRDGDFE